MNYLSALTKSANVAISVLLGIVAIVLFFISLPFFGNKAFIVRSGSMEPTVHVGDLLVVNTLTEGLISPLPGVNSRYKVGDIVAFSSETSSKIITTHRIISVQNKNNKVFYQTKGDANNAPDKNLIAEDNIIGKSVFNIPHVGKLFAFAKSKNGFFLMVIFPALIVIFYEIVNIIRKMNVTHTRHGLV